LKNIKIIDCALRIERGAKVEVIEVIFKCNKCGHKKGSIQPWDRTVEVECQNCGALETMGEETTSKNYSEVVFKGNIHCPPIEFDT
jgi:transcription elongation factor Elf1